MGSNRRILIVEDDALQAMDLKQGLQDALFTVVGCAANVPAALLFIDEDAIDFAILDYNLVGQTSISIALRLRDDDIPFIFVTGEVKNLLSDETAPRAEIFQKPYIQSELFSFLERRLEGL